MYVYVYIYIQYIYVYIYMRYIYARSVYACIGYIQYGSAANAVAWPPLVSPTCMFAIHAADVQSSDINIMAGHR
jgi:hypothetical protein